MRTLITGGHGFVGGRIGVYLSNNGHQVILGSRKKLEVPNWLPTAVTVVSDWSSRNSLDSIVKDVDLVIHTSGLNSAECEKNPNEAMQVNGLNTKNLIDASVNSGVKNFIYISTAHVYASPLIGFFDEKSETKNNHPYAVSHLAGEKAVITAGQESDINVLVIRLANAFGYPVTQSVNCWSLFVNQICKQVIENKEITLKTQGAQKRNFITIESVTAIIKNLIDQEQIKKLPNIINIGSKNSCSILEMAQFIQSRSKIVLGYEPKIKFLDSRENLQTYSLEYHSLFENIYEDFLFNFEDETDKLLVRCKQWFNAP
ncbi:MAG: hypothetical protein RI943_343 [Bacteroidota bacterium]